MTYNVFSGTLNFTQTIDYKSLCGLFSSLMTSLVVSECFLHSVADYTSLQLDI